MKRQNLYKNMASGNILAAAVKTCRMEKLQKELSLNEEMSDLKPFFLTINTN